MSNSQDSFWSQTAGLALYLLPIVYLSLVLATLVHEVIGHGLTAVAVGGEFDGFGIRLDTMGYAEAYAPADASLAATLVILAGGVAATTIVGLILLAVAMRLKAWPHARLGLLALSACCLLEGPPYVFWNAYKPVPPGDIGSILAHSGCAFPYLRCTLLFAGAIISIVASFGLFFLLFRSVESLVHDGRPLAPFRRGAILTLFVLLPGIGGWMLGDWDYLAPGLGYLPNLAGAGGVVLISLVLFFFPRQTSPSVHAVNTRAWQIAIAWGACLLLVAAIVVTKGQFRWS